MTRVRTFRRDLREIALIVIGVLIALGANAGWGYFQDRANERTTLQLLLETTVENQSRITQAIYEDSLAAANAADLYNAFHSGSRADTAFIAVAIYNAYWFSDFHPLTGIYSSIAQTGDLKTIRNARLRALIMTYGGELESTAREFQSVVDPASAAIGKDANRLLPIEEILRWAESGRSTVTPRLNLDELRSNPEFRAYLQGQINAATNRLGLLRNLRGQTSSLANFLERELNTASTPPRHVNADFHRGFERSLPGAVGTGKK